MAFARRLNELFEWRRRPDGNEWTPHQVAQACSAAGAKTSAKQIAQLRSGMPTAPGAELTEQIAVFFSVPTVYFSKSETAAARYRQTITMDLAVARRVSAAAQGEDSGPNS